MIIFILISIIYMIRYNQFLCQTLDKAKAEYH